MFTIYTSFVMPKCKVFDGAYNSEGFLHDPFVPSEYASVESYCFRFDHSAKYYWRH